MRNSYLFHLYRVELKKLQLWMRNAQPRIATTDTSSRGLESQLGRNQVKTKI